MARVVDLSHPIDEALAIEIGHIKFHRDYDYDVRGFRSHWFEMHNHNGTHVDAPEHTEPGGASIDDIDVQVFYGDGVVLDLTPYTQADVAFTLEQVKEAEAKVRGGVRSGDFVILRSDWYKTYGTERYWPKSPWLELEAAEYLVNERHVRGLGYDFSQEGGARDHAELQARIDAGEAKPGEDMVIHHLVLGNGLYHVECMTNLAEIRKDRFKIVVAPLPLKGVEAAPARVFVIEDDEEG